MYRKETVRDFSLFSSFPLVGRKRSRSLVVGPPLFSSSLVSGGLSLIGYQAKRRKMRGESDRGNDRRAVFNLLTSTPSDATSLQLSTERAGRSVPFAKPNGARFSNDRPKVSRVMRFNKEFCGGKKKKKRKEGVQSVVFVRRVGGLEQEESIEGKKERKDSFFTVQQSSLFAVVRECLGRPVSRGGRFVDLEVLLERPKNFP